MLHSYIKHPKYLLFFIDSKVCVDCNRHHHHRNWQHCMLEQQNIITSKSRSCNCHLHQDRREMVTIKQVEGWVNTTVSLRSIRRASEAIHIADTRVK